MATVIAGVLAVRGDKFLMVQEGQQKHRGKWNFPVGSLEDGESIITCAEREGKEETGFDFKLLYLVGIYQGLNGKNSRLGFIFLSEIIGGELSLSEEIIDVRWLSFAEIERLNQEGLLRAPYILRVIKDFKNDKKIPLDCIITVL